MAKREILTLKKKTKSTSVETAPVQEPASIEVSPVKKSVSIQEKEPPVQNPIPSQQDNVKQEESEKTEVKQTPIQPAASTISKPEIVKQQPVVQSSSSNTSEDDFFDTNIDSIKVPGFYRLNNRKLIIITDVDYIRNIGYDATGQEWRTKNGRFSGSTFTRDYDIAQFVGKLPKNA